MKALFVNIVETITRNFRVISMSIVKQKKMIIRQILPAIGISDNLQSPYNLSKIWHKRESKKKTKRNGTPVMTGLMMHIANIATKHTGNGAQMRMLGCARYVIIALRTISVT